SLWREMGRLAGAETGFRTTGLMYISGNPETTAKHEAWLEQARQHQLETRILSSRELAGLLPGAAQSWRSALYTASDGGAEPAIAAPSIAEAARRHGATIVTGCAVRGIETAA